MKIKQKMSNIEEKEEDVVKKGAEIENVRDNLVSGRKLSENFRHYIVS